jgi:hypothetical protein
MESPQIKSPTPIACRRYEPDEFNETTAAAAAAAPLPRSPPPTNPFQLAANGTVQDFCSYWIDENKGDSSSRPLPFIGSNVRPISTSAPRLSGCGRTTSFLQKDRGMIDGMAATVTQRRRNECIATTTPIGKTKKAIMERWSAPFRGLSSSVLQDSRIATLKMPSPTPRPPLAGLTSNNMNADLCSSPGFLSYVEAWKKLRPKELTGPLVVVETGKVRKKPGRPPKKPKRKSPPKPFDILHDDDVPRRKVGRPKKKVRQTM